MIVYYALYAKAVGRLSDSVDTIVEEGKKSAEVRSR